MKRILLALALSMFASQAFAACDQTLKMVMSYKGVADVTNTVAYVGLSAADLARMNKGNTHTLDVASKLQDKGGDYTFSFTGTEVCDGKPPSAAAGAEVKGVTLRGAAQIWRTAFTVAEQHIKHGEGEAEKGKKRAWNKD